MTAVVICAYGALAWSASFLTAGPPSVGVGIIATGFVALSFRRLSARAHRLAVRWVHGDRAEPYEVLSNLARYIASTPIDDVTPRIAELSARGAGASRGCVWLKVDQALVPSACWPPDLRAETLSIRTPVDTIKDFDPVVPVTDRGELVGAIGVGGDGDRWRTGEERRLVGDVASQVGLALQNARLRADLRSRISEVKVRSAELREVRRRIVSAEDGERRALERNIHDGAQQYAYALGVQLGLIRILVQRGDPRAAKTIREARRLASKTRTAVADLSRGLFPAALVDGGIAEALRDSCAASPVPVEVVVRDIARYPIEVETAVYFVCIEAVQNAIRHAHASKVVVCVQGDERTLEFRVIDDGKGFDRSFRDGTGLRNLADRVQVAGGTLTIQPTAKRGTTVAGSIPTPAR